MLSSCAPAGVLSGTSENKVRRPAARGAQGDGVGSRQLREDHRTYYLVPGHRLSLLLLLLLLKADRFAPHHLPYRSLLCLIPWPTHPCGNASALWRQTLCSPGSSLFQTRPSHNRFPDADSPQGATLHPGPRRPCPFRPFENPQRGAPPPPERGDLSSGRQ